MAARKVAGIVAAIAVAIIGGCRFGAKGERRPAKPTSPRVETLLAYVPCAFQRPVKEKIVPEFERTHPNVRVEMHVENLVVLIRRVLNKGARPDVLLGVGDKEVESLQQKELVAYRKDFCFVTLSLIVPADNPAKVSKLEDLAKPSVKAVGLGAESTSVGYYARQLLREAGIWKKVKPKVVEVEYPVQLLHLTRAGKFDAAIHYSSCVVGEQAGEEGAKAVQTFVKGERCITIVCPAVVIKGCKRPDLGRAFADFLTTPSAQKALKEKGFLTLSEAKCY